MFSSTRSLVNDMSALECVMELCSKRKPDNIYDLMCGAISMPLDELVDDCHFITQKLIDFTDCDGFPETEEERIKVEAVVNLLQIGAGRHKEVLNANIDCYLEALRCWLKYISYGQCSGSSNTLSTHTEIAMTFLLIISLVEDPESIVNECIPVYESYMSKNIALVDKCICQALVNMVNMGASNRNIDTGEELFVDEVKNTTDQSNLTNNYAASADHIQACYVLIDAMITQSRPVFYSSIEYAYENLHIINSNGLANLYNLYLLAALEDKSKFLKMFHNAGKSSPRDMLPYIDQLKEDITPSNKSFAPIIIDIFQSVLYEDIDFIFSSKPQLVLAMEMNPECVPVVKNIASLLDWHCDELKHQFESL